jgi:hypothetical protein
VTRFTPIRFFALVLVLVMMAAATGCASNESEPVAEPVPAPPPMVDPPGIYELDAGRVSVVGVFAQMEEVGGSWGVFGVTEGDTAESFLVAVIVNAEALGIDLAGYRGRYVEVKGRVLDDASGSGGAPAVEADSVEVIVEDDPADPAL